MSQSKIESFTEACTNTVVGFGINFTANLIVLPQVVGVRITLAQNFAIGLIFTVISVARSYVLRRFFNTYLKRFNVGIINFYLQIVKKSVVK